MLNGCLNQISREVWKPFQIKSLSRVWDDVWTTPNGDLLVELPQSIRLLHEGFPRLVIQSFPSGMWVPVNCSHLLVRECDHGGTGHLTSDIYIITTRDLMADMQAMFHNNRQCCTMCGEGTIEIHEIINGSLNISHRKLEISSKNIFTKMGHFCLAETDLKVLMLYVN